MLFSRSFIYVAVLGVISTSVSAQNSEAVVLDTVFVDSQRSYDALATENSNEYTSPAATVGTKIPAPMREIPNRSASSPTSRSKIATSIHSTS